MAGACGPEAVSMTGISMTSAESTNVMPNYEAGKNSLAVDPDFAELLAGSHLRLVGSPLAEPGQSPAALARWLYEEAPFGLLAHENGPDPRFIYANQTAQECFEYDWREITGLPSRLSAAPEGQENREKLVAEVEAHGFVEGYRGLRVAKSGRRFWVERLTMWNLVDKDGVRHGQAAVFPAWHDEETGDLA
jgi:hypothetical protein